MGLLGLLINLTENKNNDNVEDLTEEEKNHLKDGYEPYNFEEEDTEDDDYYHEDD